MQKTRGLLLLATGANLAVGTTVEPAKRDQTKTREETKANVLLQKHSESTVYRELSALGLFPGVGFSFFSTVQVGSLWESKTFI